MRIFLVSIWLFPGFLSGAQGFVDKQGTHLTGVYQGKLLFIQNSFNRETKKYCIKKISVNKKLLKIRYDMSAIKLDFDGLDLYTPVTIEIIHKDTLCKPVIINPEAVLFHTIFRFTYVKISEGALVWNTKGERGKGLFSVEKLNEGIWVEQLRIDAKAVYEGAEYAFSPRMDEGANKYRIKYHFPRGSRSKYLYSREIDYDYYPDPVTFQPASAKTKIHLSRYSSYEIFNVKSELVLTGRGIEIDVTPLRRGEYVIYFDGKDPGSFYKE